MTDALLSKLWPLAALAGTWEGETGHDDALDEDRGPQVNRYRERLTLSPFGPVDNHDQSLYGLRYATTAWRLGATEPYHEETGYWLWDAREKQVVRCFLVPRGISVLAGGTVEEDAKRFRLVAELGSPTYGICSNPFLDREFKTVRYELDVVVHDEHSFSYDEDTQLLVRGRTEVFHHRDRHTLHRAEST